MYSGRILERLRCAPHAAFPDVLALSQLHTGYLVIGVSTMLRYLTAVWSP